MRLIMKTAVDRLKENDKPAYEALLCFGEKYTRAWGEPVLTKDIRGISSPSQR